jgi:trehalose-6-phosphate synthase
MLEKYPMGRQLHLHAGCCADAGSLEEYRLFRERIESVCTRINERFGRGGPRRRRSCARSVTIGRRWSDLPRCDACLSPACTTAWASSARSSSRRATAAGRLILSRFAGAARELTQR